MAQSVLAGKSQSSAKTFVERLGRPGCQTSVALARLLGKCVHLMSFYVDLTLVW